MKNNKGFSLVELIIVIAIMAILVGVMAPQLIKYIEKTNVSADTQLADSIKTAITTAMMDPSVIAADSTTINGLSTSWQDVKDIGKATDASDTTKLRGAIKEILGFDLADATGKLKSKHDTAAEVQYKLIDGNTVAVAITGTDNTGKKSPAADKYIVVGVDSYGSSTSSTSTDTE